MPSLYVYTISYHYSLWIGQLRWEYKLWIGQDNIIFEILNNTRVLENNSKEGLG